MSYDMGIGNEDFNYTYNVSGMWYDAEPEKGIRAIYGLSGKEAAPVLVRMMGHMIENREKMLDMEPDNGWGSFSGALCFMLDLLHACDRNPDEIWAGD